MKRWFDSLKKYLPNTSKIQIDSPLNVLPAVLRKNIRQSMALTRSTLSTTSQTEFATSRPRSSMFASQSIP
ncbi:hypothetical protein EMPG_16913 [Blastomyces silverae]|uniref:Uncharacterized protein n=1 Tax=Blastomyces silverae TaxID=2060906 RepID=A0A0H1BEG0_9EURO|nr:hypothetical protein EMPG_16913 [Blastomyces silverae]